MTKYRVINIELTNQCTFSCSFCPDSKMTRRKTMMPFDKAKALVDEIASQKLTPLINYYLMGESFLYPRLFELIKYTKSKGIKVKLNTNASLFSSEKNSALLAAGIDILNISYYTCIPELFGIRHCRLPTLSFDAWNNTILDLLQKKQKTNSNTEIHLLFFSFKQLLIFKPAEMNEKDFQTAVKQALRNIFLGLSLPPNRGFMKMMFGTSVLQRYLSFFKIAEGIYFDVLKLHSWGNTNTAKVYPAWFGSCEAFRKTFAILANGDVSLCCADFNGELIVGNIHKESLRNILASKRVHNIIQCFRHNRLPFAKCRLCRGGPNIIHWIKNQIASVVHYNLIKKGESNEM